MIQKTRSFASRAISIVTAIMMIISLVASKSVIIVNADNTSDLTNLNSHITSAEFESTEIDSETALGSLTLAFSFTYDEAQQITSSMELQYNLPDDVSSSATENGNVIDNDYSGVAGTYTISGGVLTVVYTENYLQTMVYQMQQGATFKTSVEYSATFSRGNSVDDTVDYEFGESGDSTTTVTITYSSRTISMGKTASVTYNNDGTATTDWQIIINNPIEAQLSGSVLTLCSKKRGTSCYKGLKVCVRMMTMEMIIFMR